MNRSAATSWRAPKLSRHSTTVIVEAHRDTLPFAERGHGYWFVHTAARLAWLSWQPGEVALSGRYVKACCLGVWVVSTWRVAYQCPGSRCGDRYRAFGDGQVQLAGRLRRLRVRGRSLTWLSTG